MNLPIISEEMQTPFHSEDYENRDDAEKVVLTVEQLRRLLWYHDAYVRISLLFDEQGELMTKVLDNDVKLYAEIVGVDARVKAEQDKASFWMLGTAAAIVAFGIATYFAMN